MTMLQLKQKIESLEKRVAEMQRSMDYVQAIEGVRRGIESMEMQKGKPARTTLAELRRKHRIPGR